VRDRHVADELLFRLVRMALQAPLGAAAERGDRTLAHFAGVERVDEGEAAALLLGAGPRRRTRRGGRTAGRATAARGGLFLFGFERQARRRRGRGRRTARFGGLAA